MKKLILVSLWVLALGGCMGTCTAPITPVNVPIPVECKEETPTRPVMPTEGFAAKPKTNELLSAALAENERREGYEVELRTALANCKAPLK